MKRLFTIICILLLATGSFAASNVLYGTLATQDARGLEVTAEVTAHTDGTVDDTYLSDSLSKTLTFQKGYRLAVVRVFFGSPAPTNSSDFTLLESANGVDVLGTAGTDQIKAAANTSFQPLVGSTPIEMPVYGPLALHITNNSVNGAKFRIVFDFVPMCP